MANVLIPFNGILHCHYCWVSAQIKAKCTQQNWPEISTQLANLSFRKRQPGVWGGTFLLCSLQTVQSGTHLIPITAPNIRPTIQRVRSQAINVWLIFISFRSQCREMRGRGDKWAIKERIYIEVALLCHMWSNGSWQEALRSYFLPVNPPLYLGWDNGPCPRFLLDPSVFITTLGFCTHSMLFAKRPRRTWLDVIQRGSDSDL